MWRTSRPIPRTHTQIPGLGSAVLLGLSVYRRPSDEHQHMWFSVNSRWYCLELADVPTPPFGPTCSTSSPLKNGLTLWRWRLSVPCPPSTRGRCLSFSQSFHCEAARQWTVGGGRLNRGTTQSRLKAKMVLNDLKLIFESLCPLAS